ncbi:FG-GAP repeat domain-containing protein [Nannocystis radixulma]|uniref:VCBS repeat-containing protein n=1 Tax=Nannocystis radixulma TaxID=2995305 RepID=A0ABT5BAS2_9BACT|nr:VCBS repeat-containing protein [Nannocystis radixulma]MDC0671236.1 VCBS repeat-containing protein [Nannocystis radixulma]
MSRRSSGHVPKNMFFFFVTVAGFGLVAGSARAAPWEDATAQTIGQTAEWSNKVEIADIDGDGRPDILFANGAGYSTPEDPEQNRAFLNQGAGMPFLEVSEDVFSGELDFTRAIKVRDVDGDGAVDILVANTFETQSRLYLGDGEGGFIEATDKLPQGPHSFGDVEFGDVDGDGDLDAVLADWGPGQASQTSGRTRLWLGDGAGNFTDATEAQMPDVLVAWSWELEFADVDNDFDLDVLVSCKSCSGSYMFVNDGLGNFTDASDKLPQFANNYEFEPIDLTGDGFIDLITINDGPQGREHVFVNDGAGGFTDATAELWPDTDNLPGDDNMIAYLDVESDGDADFVIAGLFGSDDRLMINSGDGHLTVNDAFMPANSQGTLGIAVADLDGDKKIDVVLSEGEAPQSADRVFLGVDVPEDTAGPRVTQVTLDGGVVYARIHDNKSPVMPHDFQSVLLVAGGTETPMYWYGEALWRGTPEAQSGQLCAVDAAGNETCVAFGDEEPSDTDGTTSTTGPDPTTAGTTDAPTTGSEPPTTSAPTTDDTPGTTDAATGDDSTSGGATGGGGGDEGCGCRQAPPPSGLLALGLLALLGRRRRR